MGRKEDIQARLHQAQVLDAITAERTRQDAYFGPFAGFGDDPEHVKLTVLMKKLSDYAVALAQPDGSFGHITPRSARQELIELAAVCVALLEEHD